MKKLAIILAITPFLTCCQNLTPEQNDALVKTGSYLLVKVVDSKLGPPAAKAK